MDPITMGLLAAAVQAAIGGGIAAATPKYGMTNPQAPQSGGAQGIDFSQLVGQGQQSQLPKMQLQNRLPPPPAY